MKYYCAVCKESVKYYSGQHDGGRKIDPDVYECPTCGFFYSEHIRHSEEEQAKDFKEQEVIE